MGCPHLLLLVDSLADARTQQITFTKNTPTSSRADEKPKHKTRPLSLKKPLSFHKAPLQKAKPKTSKSKDKTAKSKPKKPTLLKHKDDQSKGRPLPIQDYAKLTKLLQTLSTWRKPHKLRHINKALQLKPTLSYKELRKVLEDMTPEIVKSIANKIIAHDMNRTKLGDMKPLDAVKSLEVHLASTKSASSDKDAGFKRVQVNSSRYKNWSKKESSSSPKVRNKHEDVVMEEDAKPVNGVAAKAMQTNTSEHSVSERKDPKVLSLGSGVGDQEVKDNSTDENNVNQSPFKNNNFSSETEESMRYATQPVPKVQTADGHKLPGLPSFIPTADKRKKHRLKTKPEQSLHSHNQQDGREQLQPPSKALMTDVQSNKRTFVHFIVTESHDKKHKLSKTKNESTRNKTHLNETGNTGEDSFYSQQKAKTSVKNETEQNRTSQENQTDFQVVPLNTNPAEPTEDIDEVFETYVAPSNNTLVQKEIKNTKKKTNVKSSNNTLVENEIKNTKKKINVKPSNKTLVEKEFKPTKKQITHPEKGIKTIIFKHPLIQHKVLHVEAKWNGQIKVKANWKDETEPITKTKISYFVKKNKVKLKKKPVKKFEENSGDDEGSDEYKFDDSGSRNDLVWKHSRPLKDKIHK